MPRANTNNCKGLLAVARPVFDESMMFLSANTSAVAPSGTREMAKTVYHARNINVSKLFQFLQSFLQFKKGKTTSIKIIIPQNIYPPKYAHQQLPMLCIFLFFCHFVRRWKLLEPHGSSYFTTFYPQRPQTEIDLRVT